MPENVAPGVFVEENSFLPKSIVGVGTSTAAFVGATLKGPFAGTRPLQPLGSMAEFANTFGGTGDLRGAGRFS